MAVGEFGGALDEESKHPIGLVPWEWSVRHNSRRRNQFLTPRKTGSCMKGPQSGSRPSLGACRRKGGALGSGRKREVRHFQSALQ
jgi:hypothetical protein